ncbi:RusA family crossover junction endodeoxyribonuclease [Streptomyces antimycoticus]|uniref:RusA family crossover junction endodeoxyribonuclease n=1 Tax=Streptomyces antimycoticus TaxID=68175 RepID=UPI0033EE6AC2
MTAPTLPGLEPARPVPAPAAEAGARPGDPDITITVHGAPAPQGSKRHVGGGVMIESSKKVKPWRQDVKAAAREVIEARADWQPLDGPLAAAMVFTVRHRPAGKPTWWPTGLRWSKTLMWRPASTPDLSKLLRATEDALTDAGLWKDDARVVEYRRLAKYYADDATGGLDVLDGPGCVIRVWRLGEEVAR